jgi:hypothetical protein
VISAKQRSEEHRRRAEYRDRHAADIIVDEPLRPEMHTPNGLPRAI